MLIANKPYSVRHFKKFINRYNFEILTLHKALKKKSGHLPGKNEKITMSTSEKHNISK